MRSAVLAVEENDDVDSVRSFCTTDLGEQKFYFNKAFSLSSTGVAIVGQHQGSEGGTFDSARSWLGSIAQLRTYSTRLTESECAKEAW
jgi:hypothetical protein